MFRKAITLWPFKPAGRGASLVTSATHAGCSPRCFWHYSVLAVLFATAATLAGCQDTNRSPRTRQKGSAASREEMNNQNLHYAFSVLRKSEESQTADVFPIVVDRLNQWGQQKQPAADWTPDRLIKTLPDDLQALPAVQNLAVLKFPPSDGPELQQTVWLSEIAKRARGADSQAVATAQSLFDWVVRNVQLERDGTIEVPHLPREILLLGRGTSADRAWIFSLLARQQDAGKDQ